MKKKYNVQLDVHFPESHYDIEAESEQEAGEIAMSRSHYNTSPDRVSIFDIEEVED